MVESYVLIEEKGADIKLTNKWDEGTNKMSLKVEAIPGKIVDVVTWIDTDLRKKPNYAMSRIEVNKRDDLDLGLGQDFSICLPPNVNYTLSWVTAPENELNPSFEFYFEEILDKYTFVDIRESLDKGFIIEDFSKLKKKNILLESIDGKVIKSKYYYPQFAVEEGVYHLTPKYIDPIKYFSPKIPVKVEIDKASVFEYYPIPIIDLKSNTFYLTAEYYHTITTMKAEFFENKIVIIGGAVQSEATQFSNYYYGTIVLEKGELVKEIQQFYDNGESNVLKINSDFLVYEDADFTVLTLRIPYAVKETIVLKV